MVVEIKLRILDIRVRRRYHISHTGSTFRNHSRYSGDEMRTLNQVATAEGLAQRLGISFVQASFWESCHGRS